MWGGEGGGVRPVVGGGKGLRQYFGYNYLEIMRLPDLTAGSLSLSRQRKNKSQSEHS